MAFFAMGRRAAMGAAQRAVSWPTARYLGTQMANAGPKNDWWAKFNMKKFFQGSRRESFNKLFLPIVGAVPIVAIIGHGIHVWQVTQAQHQAEIAQYQAEIAQRQADIAYQASDEFKMKVAREKALSPYQGTPMKVTDTIPRPVMDDIRERVKVWDTDEGTRSSTIICGLYESGKTRAVDEALRGVSGVVSVTADSDTWKTELMSNLGVGNVAGLSNALSMMKDEIPRDNLSKVPIIIIDIPRDSVADVRTVSNFAKDCCSDKQLAHIIVVASSATAALGFDAGGPNRRFDIWVGDFSEDEAQKLFAKRGINDPEEVKRITTRVGRNAGKLVSAAKEVGKGTPIDVVLQLNQEKCMGDVEALFSITMMDEAGNKCKVGIEIAQELLKSLDGTVKQSKWRRKGVFVNRIAQRVKDGDAHAIFYDTQRQVWGFASPAHREAAQSRRSWLGWVA